MSPAPAGLPPASEGPEACVVVPAWNEGGRIGPCLRALADQSVREKLRVVVSLDGGDPLDPALARLADRIVEGPHRGPAAARNRGWRLTGERFVLFTDSDCVPEREWAEALIAGLAEGADGVKGVYSGGGSSWIQRLAQVEFEERYGLLARQGRTDLVDTYSAGFRRTALEAAGGFDESFPCPDHEDVDLSYRMRAMGLDLRFRPAARVAHTHRPTWRGYFRMKHSRGRWRMKVLRRFPDRIGGGGYTPRCLRIQILLAPLLPVAAALTFLLPAAGILWAAVFTLSTAPLLRTALRTDPAVAVLVPAFCCWRALALFSGMVRGIFAARGGGA